MFKVKFWIIQALLLFYLVMAQAFAQMMSLSADEVNFIGNKIFENECSSKDENLIIWNEGEDFLSLGIGHFIWHPNPEGNIFEESFPGFLGYVKSLGVEVPAWLDEGPVPACPWVHREDFLNAQTEDRLIGLKTFLIKTKPLQAAFILKRLEDALPLILGATPEGGHGKISEQFHRVFLAPSGAYALADYINFKGLGISPSENYQGKSWGLLQVLEGMREEPEAPEAVKEFARTANAILIERVKNSPAGRNEQKWLPGWQNRINSYLE